MNRDARIAITGIGPISAIGIGKDEVWDSVHKKNTGLSLTDYSIDKKDAQQFYAHNVKDFNVENFGIAKDILADIAAWKGEKGWRDLEYLLAAVKLALDDSKLAFDPHNPKNNIGLVLTHENPGLDEFYEKVINESYCLLTAGNSISKAQYFGDFFAKFQKQAYDLQTFMFLFHVAKAFGIHGYSLFVNNACASGLYALEAAGDIIKSGKCRAVIVAGADLTSIFKLLWFKGIGLYAADGKIKPFAKERNGFVFGEGGAGIVVESLDSALKRNAQVYAEYLGGSFSLEGWKVAIPDLTSDFYKSTLSEAIEKASIKKEEIDLLVPHGVGTLVADAYEAKAITTIFGKNPSRPLITALKPYLGHNLGSCCLLEITILMMALRNNFIPPTLNIETVDPKLNISLTVAPREGEFKTIMKTACGFAGYNGAAIFKKHKGTE